MEYKLISFTSPKGMLHIVIVSYCPWQEFKATFEQFIELDISTPFYVYVADNLGDDELKSHVSQAKNASYQRFNNVGYGEAFNRVVAGLQIQEGDLFIISNDDIELGTNAIAELLDGYRVAANILENVGPVSPSFYGDEKQLQVSYYDQPEGLAGDVYKVAFAPGALWLMNNDFLKNVGGFIPDFFMYAEDRELTYRSIAFGYQPIWVQSSVVYHQFDYPLRNGQLRRVMERNTIAAVYLDQSGKPSRAHGFAFKSVLASLISLQFGRLWYVLLGYLSFLRMRSDLEISRKELTNRNHLYRFIR